MANVIWGSSMTDPNFANFRGSQTYAPQSRMVGQESIKPIGYGMNQAMKGFTESVQGAQNATSGLSNAANVANNLEQIPAQPQIDYSGFDQAMAGFDEAANAAAGSTQADISGLQGTAQSNIQKQQSYLQGQEAAALQEEQKAQQLAKTDTNQQRSALSEIMQGIQSLYGGTTGTGRFAGELAGRTAFQNIGQIQTNLVNAVTGVRNSLAKIRQNVKDTIDEINMQTTTMIQKAKAELQTNLANIRMQKGILQADKAKYANDAMQRYQDTVVQINARNTQFKQQVAMQERAIEQKATEMMQQKIEAIAMNNPQALQQLVQNIPAGMTVSGTGNIGGALTNWSYRKPEDQYAGLLPTGVGGLNNTQTAQPSGTINTGTWIK